MSFTRILTLALALSLVSACASRDLRPGFTPEREVLRREWTYSIEPVSSSLSAPGMEYTSPVLHENTLVLGSSRFGLTAIYPKVQRPRWKLPLPNGMVSQVEAGKDSLFFTGGDGNLYSISLETGRINWTYALRNPVTSSPRLDGEDLFVVTSDDALLSLEARTGKWQWHYRRRNASGPSVHGGTKPLVMGDTLWVGFADGALVALSRKDGKVIWEKQLNPNRRFSSLGAELVEAGGLVYVPAYDNALFALHAKTGNTVWAREDLGGSNGVTLSGNMLFVPSSNGSVHAIDPKTGKSFWKFELDQGIPSRILVLQNHVVFSSSNEYLYALDRTTGVLADRIQVGYGSGFTGALAFDPKRRAVFAMSRGGNLLSFLYLP
jgi:outer membrane protein assembly factor BamB